MRVHRHALPHVVPESRVSNPLRVPHQLAHALLWHVQEQLHQEPRQEERREPDAFRESHERLSSLPRGTILRTRALSMLVRMLPHVRAVMLVPDAAQGLVPDAKLIRKLNGKRLLARRRFARRSRSDHKLLGPPLCRHAPRTT